MKWIHKKQVQIPRHRWSRCWQCDLRTHAEPSKNCVAVKIDNCQLTTYLDGKSNNWHFDCSTASTVGTLNIMDKVQYLGKWVSTSVLFSGNILSFSARNLSSNCSLIVWPSGEGDWVVRWLFVRASYLAVESLGAWHKMAISKVKKLGSALARHTGEEETTTIRHLFQQLSIALAKGNVALFNNRIPSDTMQGDEGFGW